MPEKRGTAKQLSGIEYKPIITLENLVHLHLIKTQNKTHVYAAYKRPTSKVRTHTG